MFRASGRPPPSSIRPDIRLVAADCRALDESLRLDAAAIIHRIEAFRPFS